MVPLASVVDFGRKWRFHIGEAYGAEVPGYDDADWVEVTLPHTYNDEDTFVPPRGYYRGPAWYRKTFGRPRGAKVLLRLDSTWGKVNAWLNGKDLGEHLDGLVGFELDLTRHLVSGSNVISLRVDNSADPKVLPGKPIPDYNVYGGLCGDAWLVRKSSVYFPWRSLVITTPEATVDRSEVDLAIGLEGQTKGKKQMRAVATITDSMGNEVIRTGEISATINNIFSFHSEIPSPNLWSPETPEIYEAKVDLLLEGNVVDSQTGHFGIRTFVFDENDGFILNGERLQLRGVNRHQDYPGLGNVMPPRLNRRDAEIIKEMGGNFVRTSHYPQHPSFLNACDKLGILVYEEIATWQFIGGDDFIASADAMMANMIRRDRNHPSIILWGMMNEGRSKRLLERLKQTALSHDPTRPTIYADNKLGEGVQQGTVFVPHVLGVNYKLESIDAFHSAYPHVKLLVSEHTNADNALRGRPNLEKNQSERIAADLDIIESRAFIAGSALWSMHDYGTDYEPVWPIQRSGVLDMYRNPKEAFYMLRARWGRLPTIHIASDWNHPHNEGEEVEIRVYTNCDEVELTLNGRLLGTKTGGNPVIWRVPHTPGKLTALGGTRNGVVISHSVGAPEGASRIELSCPSEIKGDCRDAIPVMARITDEGGNTVPGFANRVNFKVKGPAKLVGRGGSTAAIPVAGIADIILKSKGRRGRIRLTATAAGTKSASAEIISL